MELIIFLFIVAGLQCCDGRLLPDAIQKDAKVASDDVDAFDKFFFAGENPMDKETSGVPGMEELPVDVGVIRDMLETYKHVEKHKIELAKKNGKYEFFDSNDPLHLHKVRHRRDASVMQGVFNVKNEELYESEAEMKKMLREGDNQSKEVKKIKAEIIDKVIKELVIKMYPNDHNYISRPKTYDLLKRLGKQELYETARRWGVITHDGNLKRSKISNAVHRHRRHSDYEYSYDHLDDDYEHEEEHEEESGNETSVQDDVIPLKDSSTRKKIFRTDHQISGENSESGYEEANLLEEEREENEGNYEANLLEEEDYEDNYEENLKDDNYNDKLKDNNYDGYFDNDNEQSRYIPNDNQPEDGYNDEQPNDSSKDGQPEETLDGYTGEDKYNKQDFQDQNYIGRKNRNDDDVFKDVERGFIEISSAENEEDDSSSKNEEDAGSVTNEILYNDGTATNEEDAENDTNVTNNNVNTSNITVLIGDVQDKKNYSASANKENILAKTDIIKVFDGSNDKKVFTTAAEKPIIVHEGGSTYTLLPWKRNSTKDIEMTTKLPVDENFILYEERRKNPVFVKDKIRRIEQAMAKHPIYKENLELHLLRYKKLLELDASKKSVNNTGIGRKRRDLTRVNKNQPPVSDNEKLTQNHNLDDNNKLRKTINDKISELKIKLKLGNKNKEFRKIVKSQIRKLEKKLKHVQHQLKHNILPKQHRDTSQKGNLKAGDNENSRRNKRSKNLVLKDKQAGRVNNRKEGKKRRYKNTVGKKEVDKKKRRSKSARKQRARNNGIHNKLERKHNKKTMQHKKSYNSRDYRKRKSGHNDIKDTIAITKLGSNKVHNILEEKKNKKAVDDKHSDIIWNKNKTISAQKDKANLITSNKNKVERKKQRENSLKKHNNIQISNLKNISPPSLENNTPRVEDHVVPSPDDPTVDLNRSNDGKQQYNEYVKTLSLLEERAKKAEKDKKEEENKHVGSYHPKHLPKPTKSVPFGLEVESNEMSRHKTDIRLDTNIPNIRDKSLTSTIDDRIWDHRVGKRKHPKDIQRESKKVNLVSDNLNNKPIEHYHKSNGVVTMDFGKALNNKDGIESSSGNDEDDSSYLQKLKNYSKKMFGLERDIDEADEAETNEAGETETNKAGKSETSKSDETETNEDTRDLKVISKVQFTDADKNIVDLYGYDNEYDNNSLDYANVEEDEEDSFTPDQKPLMKSRPDELIMESVKEIPEDADDVDNVGVIDDDDNIDDDDDDDNIDDEDDDNNIDYIADIQKIYDDDDANDSMNDNDIVDEEPYATKERPLALHY